MGVMRDRRDGKIKWPLVFALGCVAAIIATTAWLILREEYVAPIADGAIPVRIGCEIGCDRLNLFSSWYSYLYKVAEIKRRDRRCKQVEWVGVDHHSNPRDPVFVVMCGRADGSYFNTEYSLAEVKDGIKRYRLR
ncbi:hypothetical protein D9M72_266400 [compost metagenome]